MTDMASASIGTGSPINCAHANEVPGVCPCGPSCYCKTHTCKNRGEDGREPGWMDRLNREVLDWAERHVAWRDAAIRRGEFPAAYVPASVTHYVCPDCRAVNPVSLRCACKMRNSEAADTLTEAQRSEQFRARSGRRMGEFLGALRESRMAAAQERLMDNTEAMRESFQYGCGREHPFPSAVMARCMGFPHCSVCVKEREEGRLLTKAEYDAALLPVATAGYKRPADLLPFCDIATCPKCGSLQIAAKHRKAGREYDFGPTHVTPEVLKPERIERTCERCGYSWDEMPLDGGASG